MDLSESRDIEGKVICQVRSKFIDGVDSKQLMDRIDSLEMVHQSLKEELDHLAQDISAFSQSVEVLKFELR